MTEPDRAWRTWIPLAVALASLALILPGLGRLDLWYDEAFSVTATHQLWESLFRRSGSMALYYLFLAPWKEVSLDAAWLRLPSALAAAASVGVSIRFAASHFGPRVAAWTGLLLVASYGVTRYGQEARSYAFIMLAVVWSWDCFLRLTGHESSPSTRAWAGWGAINAALVYLHPLSGLVAVTQALALRSHPTRADELTRRSIPGWLTAAALLVPMLVTFGFRTGAAPNWAPPVGAETFSEALHLLAGLETGTQVLVFVALVGASALVLVSPRGGDPEARWRAQSLLWWVWIPPIVLILISLANPMFMGRYVIAIVPGASILMALAIERLPVPRLASLATGAVVVAVISVGWTSLPRQGHQWRAAADHVAVAIGSDDVHHGVAFNYPEVRQPFEVNGSGHLVLDKATPVEPSAPWGTNLRYHDEMEAGERAERLADVEVLWVLVQTFGDPDEPDIEAYEALGYCEADRHWYFPIELVRMEPCHEEQ